MIFTDFPLDERLQRALVTSGFVTPTPIQAAALPVAMDGRDLVGTAQTGTGKTAAFVLPILHHILATPLDMRRTRAVILAPTRELVEQILAVVRELGVHTTIRAVAVYGGMPMQAQTRALRGGVEIVVACPGRLLDHMKRRNPDFRQLDCLVLDEADRMLDMGFIPDIEEIISNMPEQRQTMLFSATFANRLNVFVRQTLKNPVRIAVDTAVAAQTVNHTLYQVKESAKVPFLMTLLKQLQPVSDSVLIFTRTRVTANEVAGHLHAAGMTAGVLHAEKTQNARQETLDRYRAGIFPYLVATDIAARGIDVTSISHVINYDLPTKADDYLHRIGRTGRMERAGHAISLVTRGDMRSLHDIERMLGKRMDVARLEGAETREMNDLPITHENVARPPHSAPHPIEHAAQPRRHREDLFPRVSQRSAAPFQHADRPQRSRHAEVQPVETRRKEQFDDVTTAFTPAAQKSASRLMPSPKPARSGPRHGAAAPNRAERLQRKREEEAPPSRSAQTAKPFAAENASVRVPRPMRADRPQRRRDVEAPPSRNEQPAKPFATENSSVQTPRPARADRRPRRMNEASTAPKRRDHSVDDRFPDMAPAETARPPRAGGKPFTGMASAAKYNRKHAAGKRQPGEVAGGGRAHGKRSGGK